MEITRAQAHAMVEAVMATLWERRPFKWDLGTMMFEGAAGDGEPGPRWREMMVVMEDAVTEEAKAW